MLNYDCRKALSCFLKSRVATVARSSALINVNAKLMVLVSIVRVIDFNIVFPHSSSPAISRCLRVFGWPLVTKPIGTFVPALVLRVEVDDLNALRRVMPIDFEPRLLRV